MWELSVDLFTIAVPAGLSLKGRCNELTRLASMMGRRRPIYFHFQGRSTSLENVFQIRMFSAVVEDTESLSASPLYDECVCNIILKEIQVRMASYQS